MIIIDKIIITCIISHDMNGERVIIIIMVLLIIISTVINNYHTRWKK